MICILGATATGKTRLAVALAEHFNGEIISADSRQVYRGLDIGSGKDLDEYGSTPYHLIDIVDPRHEFNVFEFVLSYNEALQKIRANKKLPFLVGGTGMYLDAILSAYQLTVRNTNHSESLSKLSDTELSAKLNALLPQQHNTSDSASRARMISAIEIALAEQAGEPIVQATPSQTLILGIAMPRETIRERITLRLKQRLAETQSTDGVGNDGLAKSKEDLEERRNTKYDIQDKKHHLNTVQELLRDTGIKTVIIPDENSRDLKEIPDNIKADLVIKPVKWIEEVLSIALEHPVEKFQLAD